MGMFTDKYGDFNLRGMLAAITFGVIAAVGGCTGCRARLNDYEYSCGSRAGVVNKMTKKGLIWKTHEGQMALEGIVSSGESMGANVWEFSIDNQARHKENIDELAKKLNEALESGRKVKVTYTEVLGGWPWRGSTGYYVQSVEPIVKKKNVQDTEPSAEIEEY